MDFTTIRLIFIKSPISDAHFQHPMGDKLKEIITWQLALTSSYYFLSLQL